MFGLGIALKKKVKKGGVAHAAGVLWGSPQRKGKHKQNLVTAPMSGLLGRFWWSTQLARAAQNGEGTAG